MFQFLAKYALEKTKYVLPPTLCFKAVMAGAETLRSTRGNSRGRENSDGVTSGWSLLCAVCCVEKPALKEHSVTELQHVTLRESD